MAMVLVVRYGGPSITAIARPWLEVILEVINVILLDLLAGVRSSLPPRPSACRGARVPHWASWDTVTSCKPQNARNTSKSWRWVIPGDGPFKGCSMNFVCVYGGTMRYRLQMGPAPNRKIRLGMEFMMAQPSAPMWWHVSFTIDSCVFQFFSRASRSTIWLVVLDTPCSSQKMTWMRRKRISWKWMFSRRSFHRLSIRAIGLFPTKLKTHYLTNIFLG